MKDMKSYIKIRRSNGDNNIEIRHEVITGYYKYDKLESYNYDVPVSELYKILIQAAKEDKPGSKNSDIDKINDEKISEYGCELLGVRCEMEGHDKTHNGRNYMEKIKDTGQVIYETLGYFWLDNAKGIRDQQYEFGRTYYTFAFVFPNNEVLNVEFYGSLPKLRKFKHKDNI